MGRDIFLDSFARSHLKTLLERITNLQFGAGVFGRPSSASKASKGTPTQPLQPPVFGSGASLPVFGLRVLAEGSPSSARQTRGGQTPSPAPKPSSSGHPGEKSEEESQVFTQQGCSMEVKLHKMAFGRQQWMCEGRFMRVELGGGGDLFCVWMVEFCPRRNLDLYFIWQNS